MYVVSQVFVIVSYTLLAVTYGLKKRKSILLFSFASIIANAFAFAFLSAWSGFAMSLVAITRNIIFLVQGRKDVSEKINSVDWIILGSLYIISIVSTVFTYDGFLSLLPVAATMIYTYSIWQKNTKVYRMLGVFVSVLWICYNIFIESIFGIILESILLVCEVVGTIKKEKEESL